METGCVSIGATVVNRDAAFALPKRSFRNAGVEVKSLLPPLSSNAFPLNG
jgi:hypothetical protein